MTDKNLSLHGYDFGEADDVPMPDDPAFDAWINSTASSINVPPAVPRAELWESITARVAQTQHAEGDTRVRPLTRTRIFLPVALAAALIMGIALDRMMPRPGSGAATQTAVVAPHRADSVASGSQTSTKLYRLAAQQTLTQAEALLTAYRASDLTARDPQSAHQLGQWGRQVLSSTRLLIDSPAGNDPRLKPLLEDLEVVLVQIIRLTGEPLDKSERDLIDGAITNRHLLPRIRSAVPSGTSESATD